MINHVLNRIYHKICLNNSNNTLTTLSSPHTHRQTYKHIDRHTDRRDRQTDKHTDRQTNTHITTADIHALLT